LTALDVAAVDVLVELVDVDNVTTPAADVVAVGNRAVATVPDEMLLALSAVKALPFPENEVAVSEPVMVSPVLDTFPLARSYALLTALDVAAVDVLVELVDVDNVTTPAADVVAVGNRAVATVPDEMLLALSAVKALPFPENEVAVSEPVMVSPVLSTLSVAVMYAARTALDVAASVIDVEFMEDDNWTMPCADVDAMGR